MSFPVKIFSIFVVGNWFSGSVLISHSEDIDVIGKDILLQPVLLLLHADEDDSLCLN